MSYTGISKGTIDRISKQETGGKHWLWVNIAKLTRVKMAFTVVLVAVMAFGLGSYIRRDLKVGDLDPGAPELRPDSRYNLDNRFMVDNYQASSDVFVVMLKTPEAGNSDYNVVVAVDLLKRKLLQLEGVQNVVSLVDYLKLLTGAYSEGNVKWMALSRSRRLLNNTVLKVPHNLSNFPTGALSPILVYLTDHKAETLERVVEAVEAFAGENNTNKGEFLLAAGNAGIEAATNIEVERAQLIITVLIFSVVFLVCLITYRTLKSALCVVLPLYLTSVLCEALMTKLGIGIKVATLPVIAVGVGIGVDYAIYIYNKIKYYLDKGYDLETAYYHTLNTTGRAVVFTGITLSIGVGTWIFSPIKFQADMGLLLTFIFLVNIVGAIVILPSILSLLKNTGRQGKTAKGLAPKAGMVTSDM
jgi:predicted RND superfamily exporter protein